MFNIKIHALIWHNSHQPLSKCIILSLLGSRIFLFEFVIVILQYVSPYTMHDQVETA